MAVFLGTIFSDLNFKEKSFLSWFGVRGIGSIYYLYYAINLTGLTEGSASLINYTLWTILFSVFIHGISAKIILKRFGSTHRIASM